MSIRYTAMALIGLNGPTQRLTRAGDHQFVWDAFADAKAEVVGRAEILREYLESSDCGYEVHSESGSYHYEVTFEYGPPSLAPALPLKVVFGVHCCLDQDLRRTGSPSPGVPR
jgi:hypothetical protein